MFNTRDGTLLELIGEFQFRCQGGCHAEALSGDLTDEERQDLRKLISTGKGAAKTLRRARLLLLADEADYASSHSNRSLRTLAITRTGITRRRFVVG